MKKEILMLVALFLMSTNVFADGLTATLQQGDKMSPFYGADAFKQAYEKADSGAVITLSAGTFNNINGSVAKSVKIIGNYGLNASDVTCTILSSMTIAANKVTVDGIYFSGNVTLGNIEGCNIMHSWIEGTLIASKTDWHTNTIVDQCVIKEENANQRGKNYTIKNSTIHHFGAINTSSNIAYITNCYIYIWYRYWLGGSIKQPYAIYKNNILGLDTNDSSRVTFTHNYTLNSPSEYYYNHFTQWNTKTGVSTPNNKTYIAISYNSGCVNSGNSASKYSPTLISNFTYPNTSTAGKGQDETNIGITGGTGFKLYPNIPRITNSTISSNTDSEGKISIKINVAIP